MRPILSLAQRVGRRGTLSSFSQFQQQQRNIFGFSFGKKEATPSPPPRQVLLSQEDLFHPLSKSPIPSMRARAERIKSQAPCPVTLNRDGVRKLVQFECPDCGWPTHYSEKEWAEDTEHGKYVTRLREANEDEHDLRSGREITEFRLPGQQGFEEVINFSSWDIFFYTRNHPSIETDRSRRHVSKLLTFPCTVAGTLHENSPYTKRNRRLTHEGLRSMVALRQILHPTLGARPSLDVMRIFVVGARAESTLPPSVWDQLSFMFPGVPLHIFLIGPEATVPAKNSMDLNTTSSQRGRQRSSNYGVPSRTVTVSDGLTMTWLQCNYEDIHSQLEPFDPYTDVFFAFSPGFGFPSVIGQDEVNRARWEARDEQERMVNARETYNAGNARPSVEESHPAGGDTPSKEPHLRPPPTTTEKPMGGYTSLTTAPIVQAQREWAKALGQILSTKCALISTGFSPADVERDILAFESVEGIQGEFEWLITPGENTFSSQQWAIGESKLIHKRYTLLIIIFFLFSADFDVRVAVKANWGLWAVRGKSYNIVVEPNSLWSGGLRGSSEES
jgi:splicing suppressor protein 51